MTTTPFVLRQNLLQLLPFFGTSGVVDYLPYCDDFAYANVLLIDALWFAHTRA